MVADRESRTQNLDTEWMIKPYLFEQVCDVFGRPSIDLFASRINWQLDKYVAWRPDPRATHIDAFTLQWNDLYSYTFPPFSLIPQVLRKDEEESRALLLVIPLWSTRPWFAALIKRLHHKALILPRRCLRLPQDLRAQHRLVKTLRLAVCPLALVPEFHCPPAWTPRVGARKVLSTGTTTNRLALLARNTEASKRA